MNEKVIFVAVGEDAEDKRRLIELSKELNVEERVIFTGRVSEIDKIKLLDSAKIFILPSEWEAFGISLLEAMARGKLIISTKTEGGKYLVGKENGFLYDFGDIKKLEEILRNITEKDLDKYKGANVKKAKEFLWSEIAEDLESVYDEI